MKISLVSRSVLVLALSSGSLLPAQFTKILVGELVNEIGNFGGCAWADYDNDGDADLFVSHYGGNYLFRNDGCQFTKISDSVVNEIGNSAGGAWADYDNDGNLDLFVPNAGFQSNFLYHNLGSGAFEKIFSGRIVNDGGASQSCAWGDYDNDGFVDLIVADADLDSFLYKNNGDGTFARITSGIDLSRQGQLVGCAWGDYDNDGFLDLFLAGQPSSLYHNNGDNTFDRVTTSAGVSVVGDSRACAWGDYDNDGFLDLFVSNAGTFSRNFLFHNNRDGTFTRVLSGDIVNEDADTKGCAWEDYDNDGFLDICVAHVSGDNALYRNNGDGTFSKVVTEIVSSDGGTSNGCAWADIDGDGQMDLFVSNQNDQQNFLYRNNGNNNSWLTLRCVGTASNRAAIGAKVRVKATIAGVERWSMREISGGSGFASQNSIEAHFGLGDASVAESVTIEWPSGAIQVLPMIESNQILIVTEPLGPSPVPVQRSVNATPPVVQINSPPSGAVFPIDTPVSFVGSFVDDIGDIHTAQWSIGDTILGGTVNEQMGQVSVAAAFSAPGVYMISLSVTDGYCNTGTSSSVDGLSAMVVIYDPEGGFVTGGGWIYSVPGAYQPSPTVAGKANFGFVSKYQKGAKVPTGQTEFHFKVADLNFHSTSYDWLVVSGAKAKYKGVGTINGAGNYGFLLSAIDGQINGGGGVDRFRMKIWDKSNGDTSVYDNQLSADDNADPTTALGGGSVVIHKDGTPAP